MEASTSTAAAGTGSGNGNGNGGKVEAKQVLYCQVCSFPPEYCEFSSKSSKCKQWLQETHPSLYSTYYSDSALEDKLAHLTVEQKAALEKDLAKKEKKEEIKAEKEKMKIASSKVTIKRMERNKKKHVTSIHGLHYFGVDLKKASKLFANKFGAGATVSKTANGDEEILIQGDVSYDVEEMILDRENKKLVDVFLGKIEGDQIELTEEKPKKKGGPREEERSPSLHQKKTPNLHVNYCICGEFILVIDSPLSALPLRPFDESLTLLNRGPDKRTYKLNVSDSNSSLIKPNLPPDTPVTEGGVGAAGKEGNGVLVLRGNEGDGKFEYQRRFYCTRCQLQIGYETVPGTIEGKQKGVATFILSGALTDVQNRVPANAFGEPAVTEAGPPKGVEV
ncbi:Tma22p [Sporobolomyces salmoneus]|uniref:Tma22p n=1 Tax=Sporobolomyces salmoneus TaxID=183962 RepID=UPI0031784E42